MARGVIEQIVSRERFRKGDKDGWIVTAIVGGDEVSAWSATEDEFKVGELVATYFDDQRNKAKFQKAVQNPLQQHNGYDTLLS